MFGSASPAMMFSKVLLPQPLGPTMTTNSPRVNVYGDIVDGFDWREGQDLGNDLEALRTETAGTSVRVGAAEIPPD